MNISKRHNGIRVGYDDFGALQTDESNKQTNSRTDSHFQLIRNRIDNFFPQTGQRKSDKNKSGNHNAGKSRLPWNLHVQNNGECKECIKPHSGRKGDRILSKQPHDKTADSC